MSELTAFERQLAAGLQHMGGAGRRVDPMSMAHAAAQSPKWRYQSMFGATKFIVTGVILALAGSGLFLTASQPTVPANGPDLTVSASASARVEPSELTATPEPRNESNGQDTDPDLLPGVDLVTEAVSPGVFRVLSDGYRSLDGRAVVASPTGDVWLLRGGPGDWDVLRLGEPNVSLHISGGKNRRVDLLSTPHRTPLVQTSFLPTPTRAGWTSAQVFNGSKWVRTEPLGGDPSCPDDPWSTLLPEGTCWESHLVYRRDGDLWRPVTNTEMGLPEDRYADKFAVGPDGTGWASVTTVDPTTKAHRFSGLLRYDGQSWDSIPYPTSGDLPGADSETMEMAFAPDGAVWLTEFSADRATVASWDGERWADYGPIDRPEYESSDAGSFIPRGIHFNADGTIWFMDGRLFFDGESLHQFDSWLMRPRFSSFGPDGTVWALGEGHLYAITPEAVTAKEASVNE